MTTPSDNSRRKFMINTTATAAAAVTVSLAGCSSSSSSAGPAPKFAFGVASGDPLADRVILWTHAKATDSNATIPLTWQVATDAAFINIVASGRVDATESNGFTAKVDATGLNAGTDYFYRFIGDQNTFSPAGITRTLPAASATSVKFAVFSCSLYSEGFFNAYDAAAKSDAQFALHLGDYIYEYGAGVNQYGNTNAAALGRVVVPATDIVSLADYRARYALYRSDPNLQAVHAKMPFITVWDDHEFANDAYVGGAENHKAATQGDWNQRKAIASKAYHEWLPIRTPDPANLLKIYRSFDFGNLFSLHMLDTRIEGRDQQYDSFGDADGGIGRYITAITPNASGVTTDSARKMISSTQQAWLASQMNASRATWQILGNQDIMAKMWIPFSVAQYFGGATANPTLGAAAIQTYLAAKAKRAAAGAATLNANEAALLNPSQNPRLPFNLDSWDGYPSQREAILQTVKAQGKKLVVLSGDSHNGWFTSLTTLSGERVGFEYAGASVTSTGFESAGLGGLASSLDGSALVPQLGNAAIGAGLGLIDDLNYSDTIRRGYLIMTVTPTAVKGEYVYVSTVKATAYTTLVGRTITVNATGGVTYA
ncbi:MAG: alkaline phosphatase D family protein [Betaproteobacteria bacterium]